MNCLGDNRTDGLNWTPAEIINPSEIINPEMSEMKEDDVMTSSK